MSFENKDYQVLLKDLKAKIRQARYKASMAANYELLKIYWEIGSAILDQQKKEGWGAKTIDRLATDLKSEFPDFKGLSVRNLKYMRAFAEAYPDFLDVFSSAKEKSIVQGAPAQIQKAGNKQSTIVQAALAQIPWYHHITLLDKIKDPVVRNFYIRQMIAHIWSRNVLVLQIENKLYQRQGKAITNFPQTLPGEDSDLATVVKYSLQGIDTPMGFAEYKIAKVLPKELKRDIPSAKELGIALKNKHSGIK
jgi:predicted nuclease of restriction endonuclease-like (RecB) superfamily